MNSDKSLSSLPSSSPRLGSQGVRGASKALGALVAGRTWVLVTASPGPSGILKGQPPSQSRSQVPQGHYRCWRVRLGELCARLSSPGGCPLWLQPGSDASPALYYLRDLV